MTKMNSMIVSIIAVLCCVQHSNANLRNTFLQKKKASHAGGRSLQSTGACEDTANFTDAYGYPCLDWVGYNCRLAFINYGYSFSQQMNLTTNCRLSCGICEPSSDSPGMSADMKTAEPTFGPTKSPTLAPTKFPTPAPTVSPTPAPTNQPTSDPTSKPTPSPTLSPTLPPTLLPTPSPTPRPKVKAITKPPFTPLPTTTPKLTPQPTANPTNRPTANPTNQPTAYPTNQPTAYPMSQVSSSPTEQPTEASTSTPTLNHSTIEENKNKKSVATVNTGESSNIPEKEGISIGSVLGICFGASCLIVLALLMSRSTDDSRVRQVDPENPEDDSFCMDVKKDQKSSTTSNTNHEKPKDESIVDDVEEDQKSQTIVNTFTSSISQLVEKFQKYAEQEETSRVKREFVAPPGKLGIVVNATTEGQKVVTVRPGSSLEGTVQPGDIIISIDSVDTRGMPTPEFTNFLIDTKEKSRKLTFLSDSAE